MKTQNPGRNAEAETTRLPRSPKVRRPEEEQRRVNVDFPIWVVRALDQEAKRLGVTRQSLIKVWIAERLGSLGEGGEK